MNKSHSTMEQQIAEASSAFEKRPTGHAAKDVIVALTENTLVITRPGALSLAEKALAKSTAGAAELQEFHDGCSQTPPSRYGRRSKELRAWKCAKPPRRSRRLPAL
jgi:hypothetical protein